MRLIRRLASIAGVVLALAGLGGLGGCASFYIDRSGPTVGVADIVKTKDSRPVQLFYEYQTRGIANARATAATSDAVRLVVIDSNLFTSVSALPAAGRRLVIAINNVPITSAAEARAKGFVTGLTFGLAGTTVADGIACTATLFDGEVVTASASAQSAVYTTIGAASAPPGLTAMQPADALREIVTQLTWRVLRDLSHTDQ